MLRSLKLSSLAVASIFASFAAPSGAQAAWPPSWGKATVKSVDGPDQLTLDRRGRTFKVRLAFVDVPQSGECGATEATTALKGFVRRAPKRLRYTIDRTEHGQRRDAEGRYVANVSYAVRYTQRSLAADLVRADWARPGERGSLDAVGTRESYEGGDSALAGALEADEPRVRRGIWVRCGGRTHLPLGEAAPASSPAAWSVDAHGITSRIGPIALSPVLTPTSMLTARQLAALAPTDVTRTGSACRVWMPSLQIRFYADAAPGAPCGDASVYSLRSTGPDPAPLVRGGATGRPLAELLPFFRLVDPRETVGEVALAGSAQHPWAWTTNALVLRKGPVQAIVTYASPQIGR